MDVKVFISTKASLMMELSSRPLRQRGFFMAQFCVMFKGPCRGKMCDFWARIRIRKTSTEELASEIKKYLTEHNADKTKEIDRKIREFWSMMGILNLERLCDEDPDLCAKMTEAATLARL
jgi:hypothetical protein